MFIRGACNDVYKLHESLNLLGMFAVKNAWTPGVYRPLAVVDGFFDEGNTYCFADNVKKYTCLSGDDEDDDLLSSKKTTKDDLVCLERNCEKSFDSLFLYELHYNMLHRNVCSECKVHLPTSHLLDLHIQERHSAISNFQCIVLGCPESFPTPEERKRHVVDLHQYPSNFRYFVYLGRKQEPKTKSCQKSNSKSSQASGHDSIQNQKNNSNNESNLVINNDSGFTPQQVDVEGAKISPQRRIPSQICFGKSSHRGFIGRMSRR